MVAILVSGRNGDERTIDVPQGTTLMEGLRAGGVLEIEGICGGYCLCGTCHVYVAEDDLARLPEQGEDEGALLEGLLTAEPRSRLTCQLTCTQAFEGLRLQVAPRE